ncbi:uncharacterized protein FSUBG_1983 [Fusarium subglutinans]|uniref:Uncharacterized protein n=1 Tax=Gibberella subglutinans TaxID=42677 RepID=A0A8H5V636_GIBSU|nr:uncharacterized protein FSUBG_1983 [Fusarium subglutinans]KAF5611956.1 hypothetical protein FSUBG_1983 [Fusarium subglutinans]
MCDDRSYYRPSMNQRPQSHHPNLALPFRGARSSRAGDYQSPVANRYSEAVGECATLGTNEWQGSSTEANLYHQYPSRRSAFAYHHLKLDLLQLSMDSFKRWAPGVEYSAPLEDRAQPQERFRTPRRYSSTRQVKQEDDDEFVFVSYAPRAKAFFHFACPFYIYEPEKHQQCLLTVGLKSIEGVVEHVMKHHSRSPYCSRCYQKFNSLIDRDDHVLTGRCKRRYPDPSDGVNEDQKACMIRANDQYLSEKRRWDRMWSIIFPATEWPRSPYLDHGQGLKTSMVRDFWDLYGVQLVSEILENQTVRSIKEINPHSVLYGLGLQDLLNMVIQE